MSTALAEAHASIERYQASAKRARFETKMFVAAGASTLAGAATALGLGALDQKYGEADADGLVYHKLGPVPTCAVVGLTGVVLGVVAGLDSTEGKVISAVGQAGVNIGSYIGGRKLVQAMGK